MVGDEHLLDGLSLLISLSRMIGASIHAVLVQDLCEQVTSPLMGGKDEDAVQLFEGVRAEKLKHGPLFLLVSGDGKLQVQTRQVRLGDDVLWVHNIEAVANRLLGRSCCSSCESEDDSWLLYHLRLGVVFFEGSQLLSDHIIDLEVGGSEVVRPFRCAMNLINADHGYLPAELGEILNEEPFRRDEEDLDLFVSHSLKNSFFCWVGLL